MPSEGKPPSTRVIQVSNVSPIASREQIYQLFSYLGKIEEIKVYPQETNPMYASMTQKLAYVKFDDSGSVAAAQHITNTVFIDRALICVPVPESKIPDEDVALKTGGPSWPGQRQLPPNVLNQIQNMGEQQVVVTIDPTLSALGLPSYPSLPANTDASKIEEIRRTIYVGNIPRDIPGEEVMEFFNDMIGEVMYLRMAGSENLPTRFAYIEFSNQSSVPTALQNNGVEFKGNRLIVQHSRVAIIKPQAKTQDMAKREIQEALKKQETVGLNMPGSLTTSAMNLGLKASGGVSSHSRSRSPPTGFWRNRYRRSRSKSPDRSRWRPRNRSRDRFKSRYDRDRRDRSRERRISPIRDRKRSRDKSKDRKKKSPERDSKRRQSPSESGRRRDRDRDKDKEKDKERDRKSDRDKDREKEREKKDERRGGERSKTEKSPKRREREESVKKEAEEKKREEEMKEVDEILEEALGKKEVKNEPEEERKQEESQEKSVKIELGERITTPDEDEEEMPATEILTRMKPKYARKREDSDKDSDTAKARSSGKRSKKESRRKRTKSSSSEEGTAEKKKSREKKKRRKESKKKKKKSKKETSDSSSSTDSPGSD